MFGVEKREQKVKNGSIGNVRETESGRRLETRRKETKRDEKREKVDKEESVELRSIGSPTMSLIDIQA